MTQRLTSSSICRSVTSILCSNDFASNFEDYWRNVVLGIMDLCDTKIDLIKYMWVSDLYFMVHCLYHCHRLKLILYIKKLCGLGVFVPLRALALVSNLRIITAIFFGCPIFLIFSVHVYCS